MIGHTSPVESTKSLFHAKIDESLVHSFRTDDPSLCKPGNHRGSWQSSISRQNNLSESNRVLRLDPDVQLFVALDVNHVRLVRHGVVALPA